MCARYLLGWVIYMLQFIKFHNVTLKFIAIIPILQISKLKLREVYCSMSHGWKMVEYSVPYYPPSP